MLTLTLILFTIAIYEQSDFPKLAKLDQNHNSNFNGIAIFGIISLMNFIKWQLHM